MTNNSFIIFKMVRKFVLFTLFFCLITGAYAKDIIYRIDIEGNEIVSDSTIISKIKIRSGQEYNKNIINEDVRNLYATGFFETVEAQRKEGAEGVVVIFKVKEKPVLKKMDINGARHIREKNILDAIDIQEGSFVDDYKMQEAVRKIKDLYINKGFSEVEVTYKLEPIGDKNEVEGEINIDEKGILKVRAVIVKGNDSVSTRRILKLMKTRKAWLLNRGLFKEEVLGDDIKRITDFYKLEGFSDVKVDIEAENKPKGVYLTVNIQEGMRYYIGDINIEGNKEISSAMVIAAMELEPGSVYSEQTVYMDSSRIREVYVDKGYIFAQIEPISFLNPETKKVDVTYKITENDVAYIEDIDIRGNIKTKDTVIRRELRVYPGDKFDGKKVKKSKERIENLGFFEEIRFGTEPGSKPDNVDLIVDVKEAKTGYFSFGAGYSSIDEFIGFVELRQRNFDYRNWSTFTGAGQDLSLMFSLGTLTDRFQLSFTNPWIFNKPISFGFDAYKKGHKQDDDVGYAYDQEIVGGALRLGKEFNDRWKGGAAYRFENVKISDVVSGATAALTNEIGSTDLGSGELSLSYDTRDNVFSPLKGIYLTNYLQIFGGPFLGDRDFIKYFGRLSFYVPAVNKSVFEIRLRTGLADPISGDKEIPLYERFFAGGSTTIRGYRERKIGPIDTVTEDPIGGEALFVGKLEYTYPLADFLKLATFYDIGNVWAKNSDYMHGNLKSSVGLGIRVKTPIGPISVDYGYPLDTEPGEEDKEGRFHFNVSREF